MRTVVFTELLRVPGWSFLFPKDFPLPCESLANELILTALRPAPVHNLLWPAIPHSDIGALVSRTVLGHNLGIMLKPKLLVEMDGRFTAPIG
jgi:hypothetical protein